MTPEEQDAALAGAWSNVVEKLDRLTDSLKATRHDRLMYDAAFDEWQRIASVAGGGMTANTSRTVEPQMRPNATEAVDTTQEGDL